MGVGMVQSESRGGLWRSRWAAIGAAVAVTFGGGGAFWVHAESSSSSVVPLASFVDERAASVRSGEPEPAKRATSFDRDGLAAQLGPADSDFLTSGARFFPVTPFRSFDSREFTDGLLISGDGVYFDVLTDVNGRTRLPADTVAVTYNLTVTGTFGSYGYLTVFPGGAPAPGSSSINWFAPGLDLANGGVVSLGFEDAPGQIVVLAGPVPDTATDFIVDITGYYRP